MVLAKDLRNVCPLNSSRSKSSIEDYKTLNVTALLLSSKWKKLGSELLLFLKEDGWYMNFGEILQQF